MQVSRSPIARCTSSAATVESTPPLSPHTTRPPPTVARMRAVASSMNDAIVQSPVHPHTSYAKLRRIARPCSVCATSGWNSSALRLPRPVLHRRHRRVGAGRDHGEAGRHGRDQVAVARPHAQLPGQRPEQGRRHDVAHLHERVAVLALRRRGHLPAERSGHQLHAVTDAKHRHAHLEQRRIAERRAGFRHALRAAGEDHADRATRGNRGRGRIEGQNLAVHRQFAQPPRDELRVLRAEIENDDGLVRHRTVGSGVHGIIPVPLAESMHRERLTGAHVPPSDAVPPVAAPLRTHLPLRLVDCGVR